MPEPTLNTEQGEDHALRQRQHHRRRDALQKRPVRQPRRPCWDAGARWEGGSL